MVFSEFSAVLDYLSDKLSQKLQCAEQLLVFEQASTLRLEIDHVVLYYSVSRQLLPLVQYFSEVIDQGIV